MKYKKLTKEQILISLDRLTRFKTTKEKYLRVYSDILINNLIEPKLKKNDIYNYDYCELQRIVSEIINASLGKNSDTNINLLIKEYENSVFINDEDTKKLLDNTINYKEAIKLIPEDTTVLNLRWLKSLTEEVNSIQTRESKGLKYPLEEIILVEGITEEILLPVFAKVLGYDFDRKGIQVIASGGKNQVVKMYYKLSKEVKLPIFLLLDKDAEENINQIKPRLRECDRIHLVSCGEFEDLLPKKLIIKAINAHFKNFLTISETDLLSECPMAKVLEELYKTRGLHEFKKADFAKLVSEHISSSEDVSAEIATIISEISTTNK